ncbi:CDP-glycerol glycerophosphotransferase family protein [Kitasatospora sp. NPDC002227]|uniref:CDP-glycerol glycerophosphotransferase family protein n=1 Tax=Kitasatospora sp. NPDC002227 TaxID=3154773 RepID=UPI0033279B0F
MPASATADAVSTSRVPEQADHRTEAAQPPTFAARTLRWTDQGLEITGFAHFGDRDTTWLSSGFTAVTATPLGKGDRRPVKFRTRHQNHAEATEASGQTTFDHDWGAFTAVLAPARLQQGGRWQNGDWLVEAALRSGRAREQGALSQYWCGSGEYPLSHWVGQQHRILPFFEDGGLRLRVERVPARLTGATRTDDALTLVIAADNLPEGSQLRLRHRQSPTELSVPLGVGPGGHTARLPFAPFVIDGDGPHEMEHWDVDLLRPDGSTVRPVLDDRTGPLAAQHLLAAPGQVLYLKQLADGYPQFCVQTGTAFLTGIAAEGDAFRLTGTAPLPGEGPLELVLRHSNGTGEVRHPVERGERLDVLLPAVAVGSDGTARPLLKGIWEFRLRPVGRPEEEQPLIVAPQALGTLPVSVEAGGTATGRKKLLLERRWHDTLILDSTPVLSPAERNAYAQERLRDLAYPAARKKPLREAVLYDVFNGRGYADSPRAVHAELVRRGAPLEHLWVVDDAQAEVPEGVRPVRYFSPEWYEALATCRYLVGNTHFPDFIERREGQVVVQTWHGSLLKRIAHDVESSWLADAGYLAALDRESPHWSLLVSPSAFATPILRRAFRYQGEILESGYPRCDVLARGEGAEAVRARLGVPADKKIVLYAPTWREDQQRENGDGYQLGLALDVAAARAALGEDHVLLVRSHSHVREPLAGAGDGFLYDVADYPDVQELLLAADVLVTDYSSIMFDFAVTGRPILFFTYDLDHYRDDLRGFYFDLEAEAPGPLLRTSAELVDALRRLPAVTAEHAEAYRRFRAAHCALDDGGASARVVDRMLAL